MCVKRKKRDWKGLLNGGSGRVGKKQEESTLDFQTPAMVLFTRPRVQVISFHLPHAACLVHLFFCFFFTSSTAYANTFLRSRNSLKTDGWDANLPNWNVSVEPINVLLDPAFYQLHIYCRIHSYTKHKNRVIRLEAKTIVRFSSCECFGWAGLTDF